MLLMAASNITKRFINHIKKVKGGVKGDGSSKGQGAGRGEGRNKTKEIRAVLVVVIQSSSPSVVAGHETYTG